MNVIVTGASRGLGYELVKKFSVYPDSRILALARNEKNLLKLKGECEKIHPHSQVIPLSFDLEHFQPGKLVPLLKEKNIQNIDILINNAGVLIHKPFIELSDEDFDTLFDVNVKGVSRLVRELFPFMKNPSHIVNISSMGGCQGSAKFPGLSLYSASKGALAILTECLAEEFKENGISVNCLALGAVQTEMLTEAFPGYKAPLFPDEMAAYIVDFAKNGYRYFNGKILPVSLSTP